MSACMTEQSGLIFDLPAGEYHAGLRRDVKPLSSTFAKELLNTSPYEAKNSEREDSPAFAIGRAIHELTLEGEYKTIAPLDVDDFRTKDARALRDEAIEQGLTPMKVSDLEHVEAIAAAVRKHPIAAEILSEGHAEVSALVEDDGLYEQVRIDWLRVDQKRPALFDLKTVAGTANPREFNRTIATYGYHIQAAMYTDVIKRALKLDVDPTYSWIVVSKKKPHAVSVVKASKATMQTGHLLYAKAREIYRESVETGIWRGYDEITESELPIWAEYQAEEISGKTLEVELKL